MNEIEKAIKALERGEIIVYPTDTLYAIGANIFDEKAISKVYKIKKRPLNAPLSITVSSVDEIGKFAEMNEITYKIAKKFLPGKLTIVLKKKDIIPSYISKDKIAIRVPKNKIALKLAQKFPITATSANLHTGEEPRNIHIARKQLGKNIYMYIDAGELPGIPSTIVDLSEGKIKILREGAIKKEELYV